MVVDGEKRRRHESGGEWRIDKEMKEKGTAALAAVLRPKRGPKGQEAGTVATDVEEVDEIIRENPMVLLLSMLNRSNRISRPTTA